jgi:hypothetical protein
VIADEGLNRLFRFELAGVHEQGLPDELRDAQIQKIEILDSGLVVIGTDNIGLWLQRESSWRCFGGEGPSE